MFFKDLAIESKYDSAMGFIHLSLLSSFSSILFSRDNLHSCRVRGAVIVCRGVAVFTCRDTAVNTNDKNIYLCKKLPSGSSYTRRWRVLGGKKKRKGRVLQVGVMTERRLH